MLKIFKIILNTVNSNITKIICKTNNNLKHYRHKIKKLNFFLKANKQHKIQVIKTNSIKIIKINSSKIIWKKWIIEEILYLYLK